MTESSARAASGTPDGFRARLARDLPASFVVFLIAVPLSLGIALASNAPLMAGMISAIIGGIVVGALSGAPLQVSGPAAGLAVVVFGLTEQFGDWRIVCAIVAMAGLLQILMGASRVARTALSISPAVIHGMLAGIGILIALGQTHVLLGGSPQSSALKNLRDLPGQLLDLHGPATLLGLLTIAVLVAWPKLQAAAKRLRVVPPALAGVVIITLVSLAFDSDVARVSLALDDHSRIVRDGQIVAEGAPGDRGHLLDALRLPVWPTEHSPWAIAVAVVSLALIASVESLLCAVGTDKLHTGPRANLDRELVAQGVGNTLAGLVGGMPITGVIVRSSANIQAGAKTRLSAILHGVWVLVFVSLLGFVLTSIPKSVLAALLVYTGVRLVNVQHMRQLMKHKELGVYVVTVAGVVFIDLLKGVGIGFAAAMLLLLWRMGKVKVMVEPCGDGWRGKVDGALTFLGAAKVSDGLAKVPPGAPVSIDLNVSFVDHAGWEALDEWRAAHERTGGRVQIEGLPRIWSAETPDHDVASASGAPASLPLPAGKSA